MSNGKKPVLATFNVVRDFRGARLYLQGMFQGNGYRWIADQSRAQVFALDAAMQAVERASRDWGTACAVLDTNGQLAQTAAAAKINAKGAQMRERMAREVAAQGNQRVLRQAAARVKSRPEILCAMPSVHPAVCDCMVAQS